MRKITKEAVLAEHNKKIQKAYFQDGIGGQRCDGLQIKGNHCTFSAYVDSVRRIFEVQTGIELKRPSKHQGYWKYVNEEEIVKIRSWMKDQGTLVYLQDCLFVSVALGINFVFMDGAPGGALGVRTPIGRLECRSKYHEDESLAYQLADMAEQQIRNLPYYRDADLICSVPSTSDRGFDLPGKVASLVGKKINKQNITGGFAFGRQKSSVKNATFDQKWQIWEDARVSFRNDGNFNVNGKTVILIDDMYQSGITVQYTAMKLQQTGVREVYGLSLVKAVSDKDNA